MIDRNSSSIFKGKAPNVEESEYENPNEEFTEKQRQLMDKDGVLKILQPLNFEDKVMNGRRYKDFMKDKFRGNENSLEYAEKIDSLIGKGGNKMNFDTSLINNNESDEDKVDMILGKKYSNNKNKTRDLFGNMNFSKKDKSNDLFGNMNFGNKNNVDNFLGMRNKQKQDKINKKGSMAVFSGFNFKNDLFSGKIINTSSESQAWKRIGMQKGLKPFGDIDGDKVPNVMDCVPRNPLKQGPENKDINEVLVQYADNNKQNDTGKINMSGEQFLNEVMGSERNKNEENNKNELERINSLIDYYREKAANAKTAPERNKYIKILEELEKSRRSEKDLKIKSEERKEQRKIALEESKAKRGLGFEQLASGEKKQKEELDFRKQESEKARDFSKEKLKSQIGLERAKLKAREREGERLAFEKELKYGQNVIGSLVGGSGGGNMSAFNAVSQTNVSGNNFNQLLGVSQGQGYREVIPQSSSGRRFSDVVSESLGKKSENEQELEQSQPTQQEMYERQQEQIRQQREQMMQQQPQPRQEMYEKPREIDYSNIDWDSVEPAQAAKVDPEYASYLKKSKGETTYRRGPYKK